MRILKTSGLVLVFVIGALSRASAQEPQKGSFAFAGRTVSEFHCVPREPGKHPAVILLHGAGEVQLNTDRFWRDTCRELAGRGYYALFVEYFSIGSGFHFDPRHSSTWQRLPE